MPVQRLQRRWNRCNSKSTHNASNKALTEAQKQAVRKYISQLDQINMFARPQINVGTANYLIKFENRVVNHQWLSRFLKQNPNFYVQKQKLFAAEQKNSHSVADIKDYFDKLEKAMKEKSITEVDV